MSTPILVLIITYILLSLILGFLAGKKSQKTPQDYFLASRSVSWPHLSLTIFATWFSTFAFIGAPGFYYLRGVEWFIAMGPFLLIGPLLCWFLGRKIWVIGRAKGYITPGDLLSDFYGSQSLRLITAVVSFLALIPYCLIQFIGIGKVLAATTGGTIPYATGVLVAAATTALYTMLGGVRAIIWTDVMQGILFFSVILLLCATAVIASGGIATGYQNSLAINPKAFSLNPEQIGSPITFLLVWSFGFVLLPHMWQRIYMAKSAESLTKSLTVVSAMSFILVIAVMLTGTLGIGLLSGVSDPDSFVPMFFTHYLPWAIPILVLACFAAGMSTIDSQLLSASSIIVQDLIRPLVRRELSPGVEHSLGRLISIALIVGLGLLSLSSISQGAIVPLASKGPAVALLLLVPLLGALFLKLASSYSAIASLVAGATTLVVLELGIILPKPPFGFGPPIFALLAQITVFALCELWLRRTAHSMAEGGHSRHQLEFASALADY